MNTMNTIIIHMNNIHIDYNMHLIYNIIIIIYLIFILIKMYNESL